MIPLIYTHEQFRLFRAVVGDRPGHDLCLEVGWRVVMSLEEYPRKDGKGTVWLRQCPWCEEWCLPWDDLRYTNDGAIEWHQECLLRNVVGSVGHQQKRCQCYGGAEGDPPSMTRRQAARAACDLFERS